MRSAFIRIVAIMAIISLFALVFQSTRYLRLLDKAEELESAQESWIKENRRLEASIAVRTNRAWAEAAAVSLGYQKAEPEKRLRIIIDPSVKP